jgi:hypothetical protein
MGRSKLFKYFSHKKWAEAFLEGELLFRSLSYFRDYEDGGVRSDALEGVSVFRPLDGLTLNRVRDGATISLPHHAFVSTANQDEIFVYCLSLSLNQNIWDKFNAAACIEISDVPEYCHRVQATLPTSAVFPGVASRMRIGNRVAYYEHSEAPNPRWALPDLIATSKHVSYRWQNEFRLVFSLTDALAFENAKLTLTQNPALTVQTCVDHPKHQVRAGRLDDICRPVSL